ncbi:MULTISPECIES: hypothetical protein [Streptomyces]|uniref:Uncharacterized protein n=3 Tax=Streptomyces rimosus TaxID=1927 RepID=L8F1D3_STRR1|nr:MULTISPECIES: hypothetical protein [Streptomyces]KOG73058.1 hypothetical protein ADK78_17505 [Kitasatospora aureofaciens]MYT42093.1 hypothetical protein [Streptomyces sp. SID5471]KEF04019.1 hypothetical protein DF18_37810 [Streptomyces rimosus]KEF04824.1 hypothetical protein DF17_21490 [Streptomyces rimosus]KOT32432.1 hypothetical protein ADK84_28080 [Streptomyces sp. NRRL WC-3701]
MSDDLPGPGGEEDGDRIRLSPAVLVLLGPALSASVFSAVTNLLAELRATPVPPLAQPVPGRPGWYSAPLARDIGLAEYHVGDTEPGADGPAIYVARIVISDDWPDF